MRTAFRTMEGVKQRRRSPAYWPRLWASFGALVIIAMGCDAGAPLLRGSSGVTKGDPFALDAGTHVVAWTASPQTMEGCDFEIQLVDDDENVVGTVQESFDSGGARQDVTPVMELSEGTYRLRTATTCEQWTARVARE